MADLEKEKMMRELEVKELVSKHRYSRKLEFFYSFLKVWCRVADPHSFHPDPAF